jgi:AbrB family looped-hinge helix DNA binding protein
MAPTTTILEKPVGIDKAGRLVIPKSVRKALNLRVGEPLKVEAQEDAIVIRRASPEAHLEQIDGWWVISSNEPLDFSIPDFIDELRNERIRELGGE